MSNLPYQIYKKTIALIQSMFYNYSRNVQGILIQDQFISCILKPKKTLLGSFLDNIYIAKINFYGLCRYDGHVRNDVPCRNDVLFPFLQV